MWTSWNLTPGIINDRARRAFKLGACGGLAIALHDTTGWPIVAITANQGELLHYMVRTPSGRLLGIEGQHADRDVVFEYEIDAHDGIVTIAETTRDAAWTWWTDQAGQPVPMDVVASIARTLLAQTAA